MPEISVWTASAPGRPARRSDRGRSVPTARCKRASFSLESQSRGRCFGAGGMLRAAARSPPLAAMETAMPEQNAIEPPKGPSRRALRGLDWLNFLLADVRTGLGPFLAI